MVNIIPFCGWDITTSGLEKQMSTILEIYFRFRSRPFFRNLYFILYQSAQFRPNRSSHYGNITSYRFIKMAAADAKYYFRFRICWYRCLQKVKVYELTKFRRHISIDGWDLTTSGFEKKVRHIGILLPVLISTTSNNLHVILHHATEFRPNRSTHCRNMTSFPFFKMAAATAKYQFRFHTCWCHCLQKVKVCQQTKFRLHISIDGWDITTSVFEKPKPNVRHTGNVLSVSISTICPKSAHYVASGYRISSKSKHPLRKYDVISISQDGGRDGWILLPVSYLLLSMPTEGQSLLANQILSRYLKSRLRYNYFRFRNTKVRHIGILLLISIWTSSP